jgi:DNA-binding MarR family transcriptional regulator
MDAPSRIARRPTWLLSRANARAHAVLTHALGAEGVRGYHVRVLAALDESGPLSQADVGRATGIDRSDIVGTLNDLVGWGFARRRPDPEDGRRNIVSLTAAGRRRLIQLDAVLARVQDDVLSPLTEHERSVLVDLLRKLAWAPGPEGASGPDADLP